jgi:protein TonB
MERPVHFVHGPIAPQQNSRRMIALVVVGALHLGMIYALAAGLAQSLYQKLPEEIKVAVEQPKIEKAPPPPPPDLAKPPPPFVPPPEINIQTEAPQTNAITIQNKIPTPPVAKPTISSPVSIGRAHQCNKYYPQSAQRLNEVGTAILNFTITADGDVTNPSIAQTSGHDELDQAALECVVTWHYKAAVQNNVAVAAPWKAQVVFKPGN